MAIKIFIPVKEVSQRVPKKNFRFFDGDPLWIRAVKKFASIGDVYVNTDSTSIIDSISRWKSSDENVSGIIRKPELIGHKVSVVDILSDFVTCYCSIDDIVVQVHTTSPFLKASTVQRAIKHVELEGFDSCVGCNVLHSRLWRLENYGFCPINHNPMKLEQTQDLPEVYEENSAFYVFRSSVMMQDNNRIGKHPYFMEVPFPENLDIDTEENWQLCQNVLNMKGIT